MAKKKKRKYSTGGAARAQRFESSMSRAGKRVARSVEIGLQVWRDRSERSARSKKDGVFRDTWKNGITAGAKALREVSWAPTDFFGTFDPRLAPQRLIARAILPFWD
jgi:hypothetical protein